ncbi:methylated-DNA--[protein]-cysteine S-methyltransferase [uncultured Flavonifractor sp.]|uniref:methylated-DNA--[protein]-cysteine S-methyltransferase n=1 Tax=uncultured Flavonifractor sp. TaxID=1193534 RepID=UPI002628F434|nr:methylated-DNA--[protein]-cysteine S-methyltransferase [uncultured Flavonifractor sp.]
MDRVVFDTPVGPMALECRGEVLTALYLPCRPMEAAGTETALLARGREELLEYFQGKRRSFDLPLDPRGTAFQRAVWEELARVPYGQVVTYGELARRVGSPRACRAVGQANHRNPLPIFLPCHRVVGAKGTLTGYAGGLALKEYLLELEKDG